MVLAACGAEPGEVQISFVGPGHGFVTDEQGSELCDGSCVIAPPSPTTLRLSAWALSRFGGWTGCASVAGDTCVASSEVSRELQVVFEADEHEVTTLIPPFAVTTGAFTAGGYVLAGADQIAQVDADGQPRWTVQPGAVSLRVAPGGDIYARRATSVARLDPTGAIRWERDVVASSMDLVPGGDVALATSDGVTVLAAADGAVAWAASVPLARSIAAGPQGEIVVGAAGSASLQRFDRTGAALADWALPHAGATQLAFDAQGRLHAQVVWFDPAPSPALTAYPGTRVIVRYDDTGNVASSVMDNVTEAGAGFAVGAGRLAWHREAALWHVTPVETGSYLEASDPSGVKTWGLSKITHGSIGSASSQLYQRVIVTDAACDGATRCAVFGAYLYQNDSLHRPWVEVVTVP